MTVHALRCALRTHVGKVRKHNEDYLLAEPELGVFALADGIGGHKAGEVASRVACETSMAELLKAQNADKADDLESLLRVGQAGEIANALVHRMGSEKEELKGMGTTLVLAMFREHQIFYAHVGDSRLYRMRSGRLRQLTRDHSLVQQMMDQGLFSNKYEAKAAGVGDNILTRGLGLNREVEVDVGDQGVRDGDIYLACTDGLCGKVVDQNIGQILSEPGTSLEEKADSLLNAALDAGGQDNITLVLAEKI